jgi:putative phosphotransacetylase
MFQGLNGITDFERVVDIITDRVIAKLKELHALIPVALSNRHVHLSQDDLERLFGKGYRLTKLKELSQPGQFACTEHVDLVGPKRTIRGVRVLGPIRPETQVEISLTDGFVLGINPPIRLSGDLRNTPGIHIIGPAGAIRINKGVICAARHIHLSPKEAIKYNLEDKEVVRVKTQGSRAIIFDDVVVRVNPYFRGELHLDIDEGNAASLKNGDLVEILKIKPPRNMKDEC